MNFVGYEFGVEHHWSGVNFTMYLHDIGGCPFGGQIDHKEFGVATKRVRTINRTMVETDGYNFPRQSIYKRHRLLL